MNKLFVLSRALLKNGFSLGKKKGRTIALGGVVILSLLPLLVMLYAGSVDIFASRYDLLWIELFLAVTAMIVLWLSLFTFASSFYFANDVPTLLVLPVPSWMIVAAKFVVNYVSDLAVSLIALAPVLIAFIQTHPDNKTGIVFFVLQLFLNILPPLFAIGILTMLLMRFMPFFADKDRFNLVLGLLGIVFGVSIGILSSSFSGDTGEIVRNILSSNPALIGMATKIFFHVSSAAGSIVFGSWTDLLVNVLIIAVLGVLFFACASRLYLPVVLTMSQTSEKKRKRKAIKQRGALFSYMLTELKMLLRTPAYLSNCVLSAFIMPVVIAGVMLIDPQVRTLIPLARALPVASLVDLWCVMFLIGAGTGFFLGSVNGISGTSFSRQGRSIDFVKVIPLPMEKQIFAKMAVGIAFSLVGTLIVLIPAHWIFTYPMYYDAMFLAGALLSTILINEIAIWIDGMHPKLNWEDETMAVKNNLNVMAELFISWLVLGVFVVLFFVIGDMVIYTVVAAFLLIVLVIALALIVPKMVIRHLMKI